MVELLSYINKHTVVLLSLTSCPQWVETSPPKPSDYPTLQKFTTHEKQKAKIFQEKIIKISPW